MDGVRLDVGVRSGTAARVAGVPPAGLKESVPKWIHEGPGVEAVAAVLGERVPLLGSW